MGLLVEVMKVEDSEKRLNATKTNRTTTNSKVRQVKDNDDGRADPDEKDVVSDLTPSSQLAAHN